MNENQNFNYTYSAARQQEIQKIRSKYLPPEEDKLTQLRRLDRSVTRKGTVTALVSGILGALLLGLGMSCSLVWMGRWMIPGIVVGCVGIILVGIAYPLYNGVTRQERERIAPEILRLTEELMK